LTGAFLNPQAVLNLDAVRGVACSGGLVQLWIMRRLRSELVKIGFTRAALILNRSATFTTHSLGLNIEMLNPDVVYFRMIFWHERRDVN